MNIIETGAEMLIAELGLPINVRTVVTGLSRLLGDGFGGMDLAALAAKMSAQEDLDALLNSWLGEGKNKSLSSHQVMSLLGRPKVSQFAKEIGTDAEAAAAGLAYVIPQIMNQASPDGSLVHSVGGLNGLLGSAKSFLT